MSEPTIIVKRATVEGLRILVCDDEIAESLTRKLTALGALVHPCASIRGARAILFDGGEPLDVAVCDLLLLNGNGADLLREIRLTRPEVACVLISGADLETLAQEAEWFEGITFLGKPFEIGELVEKIGDALARAKTEPAPPPSSPPTDDGPESELVTRPG